MLNRRRKGYFQGVCLGWTTACWILFAVKLNLVFRGCSSSREKGMAPTPVLSPGKCHGRGSLVGCSPCWGSDQLSNFPFTFHFHALEKEMATHSSVLAWRIPGTGKPGGLLSMGLQRVGHNWSDLAAALRTDYPATRRPRDLVRERCNQHRGSDPRSFHWAQTPMQATWSLFWAKCWTGSWRGVRQEEASRPATDQVRLV